ncbi:MAG: PCYCGC motif-containing (lipo)protein [Thermoleophilia bacterium]
MANKKGEPNKKSGSSKTAMIAVFAGLIFVVAVAGGLLGWMLTRGESGSSTVKLPDFAFGPTVPKGTAEAYQFAVDNPDVLKQIPCYCGCGKLEGHTSNFDCFVKSQKGSEFVFDKHAAG